MTALAEPSKSEKTLFEPIRANAKRAAALSLAGAAGALFGLYLYVELVHSSSIWVRDALAGAWLGGSIGFWLNGAEPFADRAWLKFYRMSTLGALAGALGGSLGLLLGELVLGGFQGGLAGRAVSWCVLGLGIGLSQGLAHRSMQRLVFGIVGGAIGGFVGGFLFELLRETLGSKIGYAPAQGLGVVFLGAGVGMGLALVEQALRRAWLVALSGRQEGRVFLLTRAVSTIGLDERADVGLFADSLIARKHAEIVSGTSGYRIRNHADKLATRLNGKPFEGERALEDGDRIEIGRTPLIFRRR